jgi:hypothetical protein
VRLAIYLNDHLAGSTIGQELVRRAAASNRGSSYGPFLAGLAAEIEEDRESLLEIMRSLDIGVDRIKVLGGWAAEKFGRLKLNGSLLSYSPLSRLVELEALTLGVTAKLAMWRALEQLAAEEPRLRKRELSRLAKRAEEQLRGLAQQRVTAAEEALT